MKKLTKELQAKSSVDLQKEAQTIREELSKMKLEGKVRPQKDTNLLMKKRKRLAVVLTMASEKQELEKMKAAPKK